MMINVDVCEDTATLCLDSVIYEETPKFLGMNLIPGTTWTWVVLTFIGTFENYSRVTQSDAKVNLHVASMLSTAKVNLVSTLDEWRWIHEEIFRFFIMNYVRDTPWSGSCYELLGRLKSTLVLLSLMLKSVCNLVSSLDEWWWIHNEISRFSIMNQVSLTTSNF